MIKFIPTVCPECGSELKVITGKNGKYKLICNNLDCGGVSVKKFQKGMSSFEISGIGPSIYKKLYDAGIRNIVDLLTITPKELIESGEFKSGKSFDKLMISIKSINTIKLSSLIESLQFDNVGNTISKEIEKYYAGLDYDFTGFDYSIREQIEDSNSEMNSIIRKMIDDISKIEGVKLIIPKKDEYSSKNPVRIIEMTGSPKEFGFNTKDDFMKEVEPYGIVSGTLNKDCSFLVTNDLTSKTSKMTKALKLGVQVVTYGQLIDLLRK